MTTMATGVTCPVTDGRAAVRGLLASRWRSTRRFQVIAAVRAPTMATSTHPSTAHSGQPPAPSTRPANAHGRANRVCEKRISASSVQTDPIGPWRGSLVMSPLRLSTTNGGPDLTGEPALLPSARAPTGAPPRPLLSEQKLRVVEGVGPANHGQPAVDEQQPEHPC